jgi:nucleoside-diphosphate-sugar epimerase
MSQPSDVVLQAVQQMQGDVAVLGAGGKMGFHLCLMLRNALAALDRNNSVLAVSRFGNPQVQQQFEDAGIRTLAADLTDADTVRSLPDCQNIFFMAGLKFGSSSQPELLHRFNVLMPELVAERYASSQIVALSTGCVYSFVTHESGGSTESSPTDPPGEYAQSCLGREAAFVNAAARSGTRSSIIRLNYSIDLRYGVLVDIAQKVLAGEPIDVSMGYANVIWQQDAICHIIASLPLAAAPPCILNITGATIHKIRDLAQAFGRRFGKNVTIVGQEAPTAWLSNPARSHELFGSPQTSTADMIELIATWLENSGSTLGKPTHFEVRDGKY